ncbi:MAG: hypothetical protein RR470_11870 [Vagococcus sp.]|uniref:hypothetical protein n=1 Tax=Vagococcus sp. TaxID=1933889 RepID=UPI002FCA4090
MTNNGVFNKLKKKLYDRSIDSEHILYILYFILTVLPYILTLTIIKLSWYIDSKLVNNLIYILFTIANILLVFYLLRNVKIYFKQRRILLMVVVSYSTLIFVMFMSAWVFLIIGNFVNFFSLHSIVFRHVIQTPALLVVQTMETFSIIFPNALIFITIVLVSMCLNTIIPNDLQPTNISYKKRIKRGLIKLVILFLFFFIMWIFSVVDKENFGTVSIFTTAFVFVCTPKTILILFSNLKNLNDIKISDEMLKRTEFLKLIYYEIVFSWSVSIYVFKNTKMLDKLNTSLQIFITLAIITILTLFYIKKNHDTIFKNWIVNDPENEDISNSDSVEE